MKKTLCSLLTVVLLISCFAGTVNAAGRASGKDVAVKTMSSIDRGSSDSESFVGIDGKTYYAVITAKTNEGVYGTTNLSQ